MYRKKSNSQKNRSMNVNFQEKKGFKCNIYNKVINLWE